LSYLYTFKMFEFLFGLCTYDKMFVFMLKSLIINIRFLIVVRTPIKKLSKAHSHILFIGV